MNSFSLYFTNATSKYSCTNRLVRQFSLFPQAKNHLNLRTIEIHSENFPGRQYYKLKKLVGYYLRNPFYLNSNAYDKTTGTAYPGLNFSNNSSTQNKIMLNMLIKEISKEKNPIGDLLLLDIYTFFSIALHKNPDSFKLLMSNYSMLEQKLTRFQDKQIIPLCLWKILYCPELRDIFIKLNPLECYERSTPEIFADTMINYQLKQANFNKNNQIHSCSVYAIPLHLMVFLNRLLKKNFGNQFKFFPLVDGCFIDLQVQNLYFEFLSMFDNNPVTTTFKLNQEQYLKSKGIQVNIIPMNLSVDWIQDHFINNIQTILRSNGM